MDEKQTGEKTSTNPAEEAFLKYLEEVWYGERTRGLRNLMKLDKAVLKRQIDESLERLDQLKVEKTRASNEMKKAWSVLDNFISTKSNVIKKDRLVPIVYGSMIFDDRKNLDYDLLVVTENENNNAKTETDRWVDELNELWHGVGVDGHVHYVSLDRLAMHCKAFKNGWDEYVNKTADNISVDFMTISSVLSGDYLYTNPNSINLIQEKFLEIAEETPLLLAYTAWTLQDTIVDRETRRAGVEDHQTGKWSIK